ncbi:hypothetical protein CLU81_1202 [Flavobacterium sp. 9]|uniref:hypothetical protein n=1 Tax=Flavobacterium sp. 9 TaxID=2035198 RepID=UPI000C187AA2|nr:hypothetical protein [Flavobacterium sp. 9]PIF30755.1 hypothetical protein CLU81_1202 [Flavobacterium sp. 9]
MIKDNINKTLEKESSQVHIISKPLKLETVNEGTKEDDILVRGSDNTVKFVPQSSLGGGSTISVTKSELDNLINNNSLIPGAYYKISGVHSALYDDGTSSGTTIYLRAATNNKLEKNGHGEFWNPRYDQSVDGFGVWGTKIESSPSFSKTPIFARGLQTNGMWCRSFGKDSNGVYYQTGQDGIIKKITPSGIISNFVSISGAQMSFVLLPNDDIIALDHAHAGIKHISREGKVSNWHGYPNLREMLVDSEGEVWAFGYSFSYIYKLNQPNQLFDLIAQTSGGWFPIGLGINQDDKTSLVVINAQGEVFHMDKKTGVLTKITQMPLGYYGSFAFVSKSGSIYVSAYLSTGGRDTFVWKYNGTQWTCIWANSAQPNRFNEDPLGNICMTTNNPDTLVSFEPVNNSFFTYEKPVGGTYRNIEFDENCNMYIETSDGLILRKFYKTQMFNTPELVTANNGATGTVTDNLSNPTLPTYQLIPISGNWSEATNITGNETGAITDIENYSEVKYSQGDKTIWGGYSWTNNSGTKGQNYDQFTLSYDWIKDQYNEDNYNKVLDIIEYDYPNDWISRRYEIESGCDVIYTRANYDNSGRESAIKAFQFGNPFSSNFYKGVSNITVSHSYFENINFTGSYQRSIILNSAEQSNCIFGPNSYQEYLTFSGGSNQQGVEFKNDSGQTQCTFEENSSAGNYLIPSDSTMSNLSLLKNSGVFNISSNEDSLLFNPSILKEIYNRPDGITKIRYYDNDDNLVISDIND